MASLWNAKSARISDCLDNLGLSTEMVAIRILSAVYMHTIHNTRRKQYHTIAIPSGSVIEGIGLPHSPPHLTSYIDVMFCRTDVVVHDGDICPHPSRIKTHYVARPAPHPGYVYIYNTDEHTLSLTDVKCGSANVHRLTYDRQCTKHGPALQGVNDQSDVDYVVCLQIPTWPKYASEWVTRARHCEWPSPLLVDKLDSPTRCTCDEWRYSFSVNESTLVWTFTDVQRKCYFILKMLCKA
jgi:hypothetical protein